VTASGSRKSAGSRPGLQTGISLGAALLVLGWLQASGSLDRLEWLASDYGQQVAARFEQPSPDLHFILVDQRSLDAAEEQWDLSWPWPREAYAEVLQFLRRGGASLVFLDFIFSEPSGSGPEDDRGLAEAMRQIGKVYLPVFAKSRGGESGLEEFNRLRPGLWLHVPSGTLPPPSGSGLEVPLPVFLTAAAGFGDARWQPDRDGVMRRVPPLTRVGNRLLPNFGLAPLFTPAGVEISLGPHSFGVGKHLWPLDDAGNLVLRFPGPYQKYPQTSILDVILANRAISEGETPALLPETFKNKVVFIGSTATGLMDLRKTPLENNTPGFYFSAATWAAALGRGFYDERWRGILAWPLLALLALLGAVWGAQSFGRGLLLTLLTAVLWAAAACWLFFARGIILNWLAPLGGLLLAYGIGLGLSYRRVQRQKQFIQNAFTQVLSPTVLGRLLREPWRLGAGGEVAEVTVYFSDLEGFTSLSERLEAQALVKLLNEYFGEMIETIVGEYEGYVDKFIGDAVMAFWGAPLPVSDPALRACRAALRNQEKLRALQDRLQALGAGGPVNMRIGIHAGPAVVGMMGSPKKLNYTIIGDTVNLASRLEAVNKQFGTRILVSGETLERVGDQVVSREIDRIRVKGKTQPTRIFELIALPGLVTEEMQACLAAYRRGTDCFWRQDFRTALMHLDEAALALPADRPTEILRERCRLYLRQPPPPDWDGVTTLQHK